MLRATNFRIAACLSLLALLLNGSWPLLANAEPAGAEVLLQLCTGQGLQSSPGDPPDEPGNRHWPQHCPLCSFGPDKVFASMSAGWPSVPLVVGCAREVIARDLPPDRHYRTPAFPRAPPARG